MEIYGKPMEHLWENDGFPYIGKHMGTNTTQCTIGFPEIKIAHSQISHVWAKYGP